MPEEQNKSSPTLVEVFANFFRAATRPAVTIIFAAVIAQLVIDGIDAPQWFLGLAATCILWWFGDRTVQHIKGSKNVGEGLVPSRRSKTVTPLKGIRPSTFLSTHEEWHALVEGFCEILCPWPPRHKSMHKKLRKQITSEYHYYMFGRAMGVIAWLIIAKIIQEAFF